MRKKSILGVLAILAMIGIASGALLSQYVSVDSSADVEQSVVLNDDDDAEMSYTYDATAGDTNVTCFTIENRADVPAPVAFKTIQNHIGTGEVEEDVTGITTKYYSTLKLENKDDNWNPMIDDTNGSLKYYLNGSQFEYEFEATGLQNDTNYSLIYYADQPARFDNWGGDNPGALIGTFTTDTGGNISLQLGSTNLAMDLPSEPDANIDEYDYCTETGDDYNMCHGAKIQLVLSSDYDNEDNKLTGWNPSEYLFETDLISYHDVNIGDSMTIYPGEQQVCVENMFDIAIEPGTYNVTTEVVPVTQ